MDLYLLLVSNVVHYIPSLYLEHQTGELAHIFMHCFVHNHHQRNNKVAHRFKNVISQLSAAP